MKMSFVKVFVALMIVAASCTSGKDSPVDSHPGSGSVKGSSDSEQGKSAPAADSLKKDTTNKM